jgi:hypothetical protein
VREWRLGKDIYWFSDNALKDGYSSFIFSRYDIFFRYYGGEKCLLKKISDPNKINKNSIVLCYEEVKGSSSWPAFSKKIKECGLELISTMLQTHLYLAK